MAALSSDCRALASQLSLSPLSLSLFTPFACTLPHALSFMMCCFRRHSTSPGASPKPARRLHLSVSETPEQEETMRAEASITSKAKHSVEKEDDHREGEDRHDSRTRSPSGDLTGDGHDSPPSPSNRYVTITSRSMNNIAPRVLNDTLTMEAKKKVVHERLKQAERLVAEGHWLDSVRREMKIYTKDESCLIGTKLYSMRHTALEALAAVIAPQYEHLRADIAGLDYSRWNQTRPMSPTFYVIDRPIVVWADELWSDYTVLDDTASFLTGMVHWAKHSVGAITVADALLPGAPLIYVNDQFAELSGFASHEVLGRNCRFMQGPETEPEMVASMKASIGLGRDCHVRVTNYRKNGSTFLNLVSLRPVMDSGGVLRFVIGLHSEMVIKNEPSGRRGSEDNLGLLDDDETTPPLLRNDCGDRGREGSLFEGMSSQEDSNSARLDMASLQRSRWHHRLFPYLPKIIQVVVRQNAEQAGAVHAHAIAKYNKLFAEDEDDTAMVENEAAVAAANRPCDISMALAGEVRSHSIVLPVRVYSIYPFPHTHARTPHTRNGSERHLHPSFPSFSPMALAPPCQVQVSGALWMRSGATFAAEHQQMLDHLGRSDGSALIGTDQHTQILALSRLTWLQPEAGAEALLGVLATPQGIKSFKTFIVRACPRLSPALNALTQELRGESVSSSDGERSREVAIMSPSKARDERATTASRTLLKSTKGTLVELLGEEVNASIATRLNMCLRRAAPGSAA